MRKLLASLLLLCGVAAASAGSLTLLGAGKPPSGGGGGGTAYVTGDRTASITVTDSADSLMGAGASAVSVLVNGSFSQDNSGATYFNVISSSGKWIKYDFGTAKIVDEAKWYQFPATLHTGNWQWEGSNDNSNWTAIGGVMPLGDAVLTTQTMTTLNGNTTPYRYYRMIGQSGSVTNDGPWLLEIEFKQN